MKVIAVDFDGTLCESKWPDIGEANEPVIRALLERKDGGDKIILWTCRRGNLLEEAVRWCELHGITFDAVNANLPERIAQYGDDTRKVSADEYWDDKSVIVNAWPPMIVRKHPQHFGTETFIAQGTRILRVYNPSRFAWFKERVKKWLSK